MREVIHTEQAPQAIGTYSQAIKVGDTVYISGQIPLVPETMLLVGEEIREQIEQVFKNMAAVCEAAGGGLADIVKINIYLTDLTHFPLVNEVMSRYFQAPYPARAALGVRALPRNAQIEAEAVMVLRS
ncbi:MAG: RidA family protein [Legionellaceae bacterium]|nr:RidA family protein [Legionellaceae bacterium]